MKIERIKFERTGGFAGIRLAADVEMDELPEEQKQELIELLHEVDFDELPGIRNGHTPIPDEFIYTITVESKKQEFKVLSGESALYGDISPLIEKLEGIAKRQMRRKKERD